MQELGIGDADQFLAPPQPPMQPQVDPVEMAKIQQKAQADQARMAANAEELQISREEMARKNDLKEREIKLDRDKAVLNLAGQLAKNPIGDPVVDRQLSQMSPFLSQKPRMSKANGGPVIARAPPITYRPLPGLGGAPIRG